MVRGFLFFTKYNTIKLMIKTSAIILKSTDLNETGKTLTVYSEKLGKITIQAKGVKKVESKLRGHIESISYVQLILIEGKNSLILKDAFLLNQFLNIKKDLKKITTAKKIADLIDEAMAGEEKDEDIWKLILETFTMLDVGNVGNVGNVIMTFEKKLINLLGYDSEHMREIENLY
jgi:DNA repair protein RecO (recombination protein O)